MDKIVRAEQMRIQGQIELDAQRSRRERNRLGQFSTPPALAEQIAGFVARLYTDAQPITFLEPAVGSGALYSALLRAVGVERVGVAVGVEVDERFATLARDIWEPLDLKVINDDFFAALSGKLRGFEPDIVIANPPYSRHHHFSGDTKRALQKLVFERTGLSVSGLAGLYVHFFLLANSVLRKGGVGAWLIPSEFMDVNYGSVLREYLTRDVTTVRIHRFDPRDTQFDDALVTSSVVVVRNEAPPPGWEIEFTYGGSLHAPARMERVAIDALRAKGKWSIFANGRQRPHGDRDGENCLTLGDLFHIRRGIATGANEFFVMSRDDAAARGIPERFLKPVLPSPRHLNATIVRAESDGYPALERQMVVFDSDLPEDVIRRHYPGVWRFLTSEDVGAVRQRYLVSKRSPWYRQEQRPPAPYLVTYMGRSKDAGKPFRFIWNQSNAIGTNLYLLLYPREMLHRHLVDEHAYGALFALLNEITSTMLQDGGRVYGGGLHKMEPKELASIPLPDMVAGFPVFTRGHQQRMFE